MHYRETTDTFPACGAAARDRAQNKPRSQQGLETCPYCNSEKCCMCDMGDDVECAACSVED
jgi:hypothetical protein